MGRGKLLLGSPGSGARLIAGIPEGGSSDGAHICVSIYLFICCFTRCAVSRCAVSRFERGVLARARAAVHVRFYRYFCVSPLAHALLGGRKVIVASEYENLTKKWLATKGVEYTFLRAYGATGACGWGLRLAFGKGVDDDQPCCTLLLFFRILRHAALPMHFSYLLFILLRTRAVLVDRILYDALLFI